ncbi:hypothetical protein GCM10023163_08560 [Aestuariibaculum suncheonense]
MEFFNQWNDFVAKSKNGTFLFHRDFMEYHSDRFEDFSLLIFKRNKLVGIFPANKEGEDVVSHRGLSYGGLLINDEVRSEMYAVLFGRLLDYFKSQGVKRLFIREIPFIYHSKLTQEFEFFAQILSLECVKVDSYYVIDARRKIKLNRNRKRALKKAELNKLVLSEDGLELFWNDILSKNLLEKFNVTPVHTHREINMLKERFSDNIKFYAVYQKGIMLAGVVMFITENVAHFQYSSGSENRIDTGALDFLFQSIIEKYKAYDFISFGSSATDKTLKIDRGLAYWKESFGANLIAQRTFEISTDLIINLEEVFK